MRSGLGGFRLFIACLALGVGGDRRHPVVQPRRRGRPACRCARDPGRRRGDLAALPRGHARADRLPEDAGPAGALDRQPRHGASGQGRRTADPGPAQGGRARPIRSMAPSSCKAAARSPMRSAKRDGVWGAVVEEAALKRMNLAPRRSREGGRRHGRGARHHRPRARPRAECLRKPRSAADDPLRGGDRIGPDPARQPAELGVPPAPARRASPTSPSSTRSRPGFPKPAGG